MYEDIAPGATVYCQDEPLGTLDALLHDERTGNVSGLLVRRQGSGELLRIPVRDVEKVPTPKRVLLRHRIRNLEAALRPELNQRSQTA